MGQCYSNNDIFDLYMNAISHNDIKLVKLYTPKILRKIKKRKVKCCSYSNYKKLEMAINENTNKEILDELFKHNEIVHTIVNCNKLGIILCYGINRLTLHDILKYLEYCEHFNDIVKATEKCDNDDIISHLIIPYLY